MFIHTHTFIYIYRSYTHTCTYTHIHLCMHSAHIYITIYIYIYIYIYAHYITPNVHKEETLFLSISLCVLLRYSLWHIGTKNETALNLSTKCSKYRRLNYQCPHRPVHFVFVQIDGLVVYPRL